MNQFTVEEAKKVTTIYVGVNELGWTKNKAAKEVGFSLIAVGKILKKELFKEITDHIDSQLFNMNREA